MTKREMAIMNEAFMIGRIYATNGEREAPAEIYDKLKTKCEGVSKSVVDTVVIPKIADLDELKKLYKDLCNRSDLYFQKAFKHKDNELKEVYENRNIGITEATKWLRNLILRYDSNFSE